MQIARAEMVAAASNAGALGTLASAMYPTREAFRDELKRLRDLTDQPFAVNVNLFPSMAVMDCGDYMDVLVEEGVGIIETSGHGVSEAIARTCRENHIRLIHKCVGVRYALKAQSIGADAVTVVGYENGGIIGGLEVTTLCLVPRVVDALDIPVIGGGGVTDGRGFLALLALGAEAVIMGTLFLLSEECPIHTRLKEALLGATETDTVVAMRSVGRSARLWANDAARRIAELEARLATPEEIFRAASANKRRILEEGDIQAGVISCGQGIGLVKKVMPMKDIVESLVHQADDLRGKLAGC
jgi:NADH:quinone reductase (non-electrogenic)